MDISHSIGNAEEASSKGEEMKERASNRWTFSIENFLVVLALENTVGLI